MTNIINAMQLAEKETEEMHIEFIKDRSEIVDEDSSDDDIQEAMEIDPCDDRENTLWEQGYRFGQRDARYKVDKLLSNDPTLTELREVVKSSRGDHLTSELCEKNGLHDSGDETAYLLDLLSRLSKLF